MIDDILERELSLIELNEDCDTGEEIYKYTDGKRIFLVKWKEVEKG